MAQIGGGSMACRHHMVVMMRVSHGGCFSASRDATVE